MELLLLQWDSFHGPGSTGKITGKKPWRKEDLDKMQSAKDILQQRIQNPPTLTTLARLCGLNEFKLKKGFREVFGTTVFGYFNTLRLEQAHQLLRTTSLTVSEIAYHTGWVHPQHFRRAFKKQYGITPRQLR